MRPPLGERILCGLEGDRRVTQLPVRVDSFPTTEIAQVTDSPLKTGDTGPVVKNVGAKVVLGVLAVVGALIVGAVIVGKAPGHRASTQPREPVSEPVRLRPGP